MRVTFFAVIDHIIPLAYLTYSSFTIQSWTDALMTPSLTLIHDSSPKEKRFDLSLFNRLAEIPLHHTIIQIVYTK
jgi:hypothetical protein